MNFDEAVGEQLKTAFTHALRDLEARQDASQVSQEAESPAFAPTAPATGFDEKIGEQLVTSFTRALRDLEAQQTEPTFAPTAPAFAPTP